jgi:hypothetical protein
MAAQMQQAPPQQMDPAMAAQMQQAPPQQMDPAMMAQMQQAPPPGGDPNDPMAQIGPVMEQFMGALEQLGQAVQGIDQKLQELGNDHKQMQQVIAELRVKSQMFEKALTDTEPYEEQQQQQPMGDGPMLPGMI